LAYAHGSATTLSVSPQAVGDLMVFVVNVDGGPVSSVSGGGVTTWNKDIAKVGTEEGNDNEIWWGVVSASGASTITVAFTGSHSDDELMAQEYSAGAGATWSTGANGSTSSTTSTVTFPSLTPTGAGELYLGFAQVDGGGEAGSTPGFSYTITSAEASVLCWDTNVSTTTSPTATQTATGSDSVGALFAASGGTGGTTTTTAATTTTTGATTTTVPTGTTTTTVPSSTTTTSVSGSGATTPLLWAGQYQDPTTGLYYMRARWYDPATGQFLSVDPLDGLTQAPFNYAGDDPVNEGDPDGLDGTPITGTCSILIGDVPECGDMTMSLNFDSGEWSAELDYDAPKPYLIIAVAYGWSSSTDGIWASSNGAQTYSEPNKEGNYKVLPGVVDCIKNALTQKCDPASWSLDMDLYNVNGASRARSGNLTSAGCPAQGAALQGDNVSDSGGFIVGTLFFSITFTLGYVSTQGDSLVANILSTTWNDVIGYSGDENNITITETGNPSK
jgi:RHS repeat-associated protein